MACAAYAAIDSLKCDEHHAVAQLKRLGARHGQPLEGRVGPPLGMIGKDGRVARARRPIGSMLGQGRVVPHGVDERRRACHHKGILTARGLEHAQGQARPAVLTDHLPGMQPLACVQAETTARDLSNAHGERG